jgi:hypothetical protein
MIGPTLPTPQLQSHAYAQVNVGLGRGKGMDGEALLQKSGLCFVVLGLARC